MSPNGVNLPDSGSSVKPKLGICWDEKGGVPCMPSRRVVFTCTMEPWVMNLGITNNSKLNRKEPNIMRLCHSEHILLVPCPLLHQGSTVPVSKLVLTFRGAMSWATHLEKIGNFSSLSFVIHLFGFLLLRWCFFFSLSYPLLRPASISSNLVGCRISYLGLTKSHDFTTQINHFVFQFKYCY